MNLRQRRIERAKQVNLEMFGHAVVDAEEARRLMEAGTKAAAPPKKKAKKRSRKS
jgi:hypothetical protein